MTTSHKLKRLSLENAKITVKRMCWESKVCELKSQGQTFIVHKHCVFSKNKHYLSTCIKALVGLYLCGLEIEKHLEDCRRKQNIVPGTESSVEKMARRVCPRGEQPGTVWKPEARRKLNKTVKKKHGRQLNSTQIQLSLGKGNPLIRKEKPPVRVAQRLSLSKCSFGEKFSLFAETLWTLSGLPWGQESMLCAGLQGKLLRVSQDKYSFLCFVTWKTAASLGLCALCWMGSGFAGKGRKKTPNQAEACFPFTTIQRLFKICGFGHVGGWLFSSPQENVFVSQKSSFWSASTFDAELRSVQYRCSVTSLGRWIFLVSLSNLLLSAQVSSVKKHTFSLQGNSNQTC